MVSSVTLRRPMPKAVILGIGYSATPFAQQLVEKGWSVWATTRDEEKAAALGAQGIDPILWTAPDSLPSSLIQQADLFVVSLAPTDEGCPALAAMPQQGVMAGSRCLYLSSSGVWIDEETVCVPHTDRGHRRLAAEQGWEAFAAQHGMRLTLCRLAGIYGPKRNALASLKGDTRGARAGLSQRVIKPGQVFNRIHRDDIAAGLMALVGKDVLPKKVNFADDLPTPPQDVITYAASLLGIPPPPEVPFEKAALSPMARSFYADNKRLRNDRLKELLGGSLLYPTYREGLEALFRLESAFGYPRP